MKNFHFNLPILALFLFGIFSTYTSAPNAEYRVHGLALAATPTQQRANQSLSTAICPGSYSPLTTLPLYFTYLQNVKNGFKKPADYATVENQFVSGLPDFLTQYGLAPINKWLSPRIQDLTNDGIAEIILRFDVDYIYGCQDGKFVELFNDGDNEDVNPNIIDIQDANRDGFPELLIQFQSNSRVGHGYKIYQWNGTQFQNLVKRNDPQDPEGDQIWVESSGHAQFEDADGGMLKDLVVETGIPVGQIYLDNIPWRNIHQIYHWDGNNYSLKREDIASPHYRFQVIQDGDRKSKEGKYTQALSFYLAVIDNQNLDWWSYERKLFTVENSTPPTDPKQATPIPPQMDFREYPSLAAYARYRIMLIYLVEGQYAQAKIYYDQLQKNFPEGKTGHAYAQMAGAFWQEYQDSNNMEKACAKAIAFAQDNKDTILLFVGIPEGIDLLTQPLNYKGTDICPFK